MEDGVIRIAVTHPRSSSKRVDAEISPYQVTGGQLVQQLMLPSGNLPAFLEKPPPGQSYMLVVNRTGKQILENQSLSDAGVQDQDTLQTVLDVNGYQF